MSTQPPTARDQNSATNFPDPAIVPSLQEHKSTLIVLHGYGDTAAQFAQGEEGFLTLQLPDGRTIAEHLPNTKFIFPQAPERYSQRFKDDITAWFDVYSWDSDEHQEWQIEGLKQTVGYISALVNKEAEVVGSKNVFLAGLSMGCAAALVTAMYLEAKGIQLGGVIGMSGWLPFLETIKKGIEWWTIGDEETAWKGIKDLFGVLDLDDKLVCGYFADECSVPFLITHGEIDETVDVKHGRDIVDCLRRMECDVVYKEYPALEHWMSGEELDDVVEFVTADTQGTQ